MERGNSTAKDHTKAGEVQQQNLSDYTVKNAVSPKGTKINLFDYWLETKESSDNVYNPIFEKKGINQYSQLKFTNGGYASGTKMNGWTGSDPVLTGIVDNKLNENFPKLADAYGGNSLDYLFDLQERDGKAVYPDVKKLLQVDGDGYYYYDSTKNYAEYNESKIFCFSL